jgi:hypothetical protein
MKLLVYASCSGHQYIPKVVVQLNWSSTLTQVVNSDGGANS